MSYKETLSAFFRSHDAQKEAQAETLLAKYAGQEEQLFAKLDEKYGTKFFWAAATLTSLLEHAEPEKVATVLPLLEKYPGKEEQIVEKMKAKYGDHQEEKAGGDTDYKAAVTTFFQIYAPDKVAAVPQYLEKYKGKEMQFLSSLEQKFGENAFFSSRETIRRIFLKHSPPHADALDTFLVKKLVGTETEPKQLVEMLHKKFGDSGDSGEATNLPSHSYLERVSAIFTAYDPEKVANTEPLLQKFTGREEELIKKLVEKYGAEPPAQPSPKKEGGKPAAPPKAWPARIEAFYRVKDPSRVASVPALCTKYAGQEADVFRSLVEKFGPEPYWEERLQRLFHAYRPEAVGNVEKLLLQHAGNEEQLLASLVMKLGPEPEPGDGEGEEEEEEEEEGDSNGGCIDLPPAAKVFRLYSYHSPSKLEAAIAHLSPGGAYHGREAEMYTALVQKAGGDPSPSDPPASTAYKARIVNMYAVYAPEKLSSVDALLKKYEGRESDLINALVNKLGPEPGTRTRGSSYRMRLLAFFQKYDEEKVAVVDSLLEKYKGNEDAFLEALVKKYGPEPEVPKKRKKLEKQAGGKKKDRLNWKERLERFFTQYNKQKIDSVPALLEKYKGREQELMEALVQKYGVEPAADGEESEEENDSVGDTIEKRVIRFYEAYNADKVHTVPAILEKFRGQEKALMEQLVKKYGPEPPAPPPPESLGAEAVAKRRARQERQDEKTWAGLDPQARMLLETERGARWEAEDEQEAEREKLLEAEEKKKCLAALLPAVLELCDRIKSDTRRTCYNLLLQKLKERIKEERRRHRALLDQRMSIYDQLTTNKWSISYYNRLAQQRVNEREKKQKRFEDAAPKKEHQHHPQQQRRAPKNFVTYNARMASVSPGLQQRSCSGRSTSPTRRREPRLPDTVTPQTIQKVLSYQRKWLPRQFEPPEYPCGASLQPTKRFARGGGSIISHTTTTTGAIQQQQRRHRSASLETRHQDKIDKAARNVASAYDVVPPTSALRSMTGASEETALERAIEAMRSQQAARQLQERQHAWNTIVDYPSDSLYGYPAPTDHKSRSHSPNRWSRSISASPQPR